jgi:hypothetical protein
MKDAGLASLPDDRDPRYEPTGWRRIVQRRSGALRRGSPSRARGACRRGWKPASAMLAWSRSNDVRSERPSSQRARLRRRAGRAPAPMARSCRRRSQTVERVRRDGSGRGRRSGRSTRAPRHAAPRPRTRTDPAAPLPARMPPVRSRRAARERRGRDARRRVERDLRDGRSPRIAQQPLDGLHVVTATGHLAKHRFLPLLTSGPLSDHARSAERTSCGWPDG